MEARRSRTEVVDGILEGAFDLNVLAGPEPLGILRFDALDTARHAQEAGLGGFLLVNDHYPTGAQAQTLNRVYPGLTVYGAVTLNRAVGGINASAVEAAAGSGAAAVLMPAEEGESTLSADGSLGREALKVLRSTARHGLLIVTGRLCHTDTAALLRAAREHGVTRALASHHMGQETGERLVELASLGAYVEHSFAACMPSGGRLAPRRLAERIMAAGVESSILTSGFGQWYNPPPAEGLRMAIAAMLAEGLTLDELETLVKRNPARLLGLDS